MEALGEITLDDLGLAEGLLASAGAVRKPLVQRLRDSHHNVARLCAQGLDNQEISAITGYDPGRISQFRRDPAFAELISHYTRKVEDQYVDFHGRLAILGQDTVGELQKRIDENPEEVTVSQLIELTKLTADRTGFGPTKKIEAATIVMSASDIARIRQEVKNGGSIRKISEAALGDRVSGALPAPELYPEAEAPRLETLGDQVREVGGGETQE